MPRGILGHQLHAVSEWGGEPVANGSFRRDSSACRGHDTLSLRSRLQGLRIRPRDAYPKLLEASVSGGSSRQQARQDVAAAAENKLPGDAAWSLSSPRLSPDRWQVQQSAKGPAADADRLALDRGAGSSSRAKDRWAAPRRRPSRARPMRRRKNAGRRRRRCSWRCRGVMSNPSASAKCASSRLAEPNMRNTRSSGSKFDAVIDQGFGDAPRRHADRRDPARIFLEHLHPRHLARAHERELFGMGKQRPDACRRWRRAARSARR